MTQIDPERQRQFALDVVRRLREAGYEALWAGGCVRDQLLDRTPKDYDVATSAEPAEVRRLFGHRRTLAMGAAFGVIGVLGAQGAGQIEVATFRRDAEYSDGRHPDHVTYSNAEEDARRRDFTMNGLFYDPISRQVLDYVGGQRDLERGVVRAIGDPQARFQEDKLRLLRAVRFAATFDFALDEATLAAVEQLADELVIVSAERIAAEMRRMLVDRHRARAVDLLRRSRLLCVVLPEADRFGPEVSSGGAATESPWRERWERTQAELAVLVEPTFATALACLLRGLADDPAEGPALARQAAGRWRLSNDELESAAWQLEQLPVLLAAPTTPWPRLQPVLAALRGGEAMTLAEAVAAVDPAHAAAVAYCRERLAWPVERLNPPPLVTGHDLLAAGLPAGRTLGRLLAEIRDEQLAGRLATREEAIAWALRPAPETGG